MVSSCSSCRAVRVNLAAKKLKNLNLFRVSKGRASTEHECFWFAKSELPLPSPDHIWIPTHLWSISPHGLQGKLRCQQPWCFEVGSLSKLAVKTSVSLRPLDLDALSWLKLGSKLRKLFVGQGIVFEESCLRDYQVLRSLSNEGSEETNSDRHMHLFTCTAICICMSICVLHSRQHGFMHTVYMVTCCSEIQNENFGPKVTQNNSIE